MVMIQVIEVNFLSGISISYWEKPIEVKILILCFVGLFFPLEASCAFTQIPKVQFQTFFYNLAVRGHTPIYIRHFWCEGGGGNVTVHYKAGLA